jgi:hypothetical protein
LVTSALLIAAAAASASHVHGQTLLLEGPEFQVNEAPFGPQWNARVGAGSQSFLVVWAGLWDGPDVGLEIFGRILDPEGNLGPEFKISAQGNDTADYPTVASCPDGTFVVSWLSMPGGISGVWGRSLSSVGVPLSDPFLISPAGVSPGEYYAVICDANNEIVGSWRSTRPPSSPARNLIQKFARSGAPLTAAVEMDDGIWGTRGTAALLPLADGSLVALWQVYAPPSQLTTVARKFSSTLEPASDEILLPMAELGCSTMDALLLSDDVVAIAFDCYFNGSIPYQVRLTTFDLTGPAMVSTFTADHPVNTATRGPRIASAPLSGLVATWSFLELYANGHLEFGLFDGALEPRELPISPPVPEGFARSNTDIALTPDGAGLAIWNSYGEDGSGDGVFAQRVRIQQPRVLEVPALSPTGMTLLGALLAGVAFAVLRRRSERLDRG